MSDRLLRDAHALGPTLTDWRRRLHAHPELSGEERQTATFVAATLREIGYEPVENVGDSFGVLAELRIDDARWIALRADMDALPIHEETGLPFASRNAGVMHACGHDAHTAMLLGAAKLLHDRRDDLRRSVRFVFQPHEEKYPGGAPNMIAGGALRDVESIFGLHIISQLPAGVVAARGGPFMAAVNGLEIVVRGQGGHAAMPENTVDPVLVAAQIIVALQSVVSRSIAPSDVAVVSVTQVNAGSADNVIPPEATLRGTIRTFEESVRTRVCARVREVAEQIARAFGAVADVKIHPGYPALVNDPDVLDRALAAARRLGVPDERILNVPPQGGGEDFAYYLQQSRGAFVFLGAQNPAKGCSHPHHHPRFDVDEDVMPLGAALLAQYALDATP
ncbi:MAG: M20 family metallopeptidase [Phycisphaerae bacterium]